jgi:ribosomal protein L11 methyltransferase
MTRKPPKSSARGTYRKISVTTSLSAEEPISALMESIFGLSPVSWRTPEESVITISIYLRETNPNINRARAQIRNLKNGIVELAELGIDVESGAISNTRLPEEDWAESWKIHFKPIEVEQTLIIKPGWDRSKPKVGRKVIILDPGLSFGTGHHPTTLFCLKQLIDVKRHGLHHSMLDVGTGSGLLSIAAAKLGFGRIHGFDWDPDAVRSAKENAHLNQTSHLIRITRYNLLNLTENPRIRYTCICANLTADLLMQASVRFWNRLRPGGRLILAGILTVEFDAVKQFFRNAGFIPIDSESSNEWTSGSFERPE